MPSTLPRFDNVSLLLLVITIITAPCSSTQASSVSSSSVDDTREQGFWSKLATKAATSNSDTREWDDGQDGVIHLPLVRRSKRSAPDVKKEGGKESGSRSRRKRRNTPKPVALRDVQDMCVLSSHKVRLI